MQVILDKNNCNNVDVTISSEVLGIWKDFCQTSWWSKEACGVLIGGYDASQKMIIIDTCTVPMKGDIRRRNSFNLQDKGHQQAVDKAYMDSNGTSFYLGTWHTHPTKKPSPSYRDLCDWNTCIERNPLIPSFIFAIVGTESVFLHTRLTELK